MKKTVFIVLVLVISVSLAGCGKKEQPLEEMQEPLSMEALSSLNATSTAIAEPKTPAVPAVPGPAMEPAVELKPLPPSGPYKPSASQIQTALKNSGYYTGSIDGKMGPMTKKAIEEFQKANGLEADGKVGPKTWSVLSAYLNPAPSEPEQAVPAGNKKR